MQRGGEKHGAENERLMELYSEGNVQLWQAPQQDPRSVQALRYANTLVVGDVGGSADGVHRSPLSPRPEAYLRKLRLPERRHQEVYVPPTIATTTEPVITHWTSQC